MELAREERQKKEGERKRKGRGKVDTGEETQGRSMGGETGKGK